MAVRPIAVGECLRRVVGKVAMGSSHVKDAIAQLVPLQVGVAVPGACETTAIALQNFVRENASDASWAILQVDVRNAFNSIDRKKVMEAVASVAPQLLEWVTFCYHSHSTSFLPNGHPIRSEQGVQQGDPLGPLLYSLAWHTVVSQLPPSLRLNLWYLDDGHLVGDMPSLRAALDIILTQGSTMGVVVNEAKCSLWGPGARVDAMADGPLANVPIIPWEPESGIRVLGLPICYPGNIAFGRSLFGKVLADLSQATTVLHTLGDTQTEHLLLRYCLDACKVMHLLRRLNVLT